MSITWDDGQQIAISTATSEPIKQDLGDVTDPHGIERSVLTPASRWLRVTTLRLHSETRHEGTTGSQVRSAQRRWGRSMRPVRPDTQAWPSSSPMSGAAGQATTRPRYFSEPAEPPLVDADGPQQKQAPAVGGAVQ